MNKKRIKELLNLSGGSTRMVFFFGKYAVKIPRLDLGISGYQLGLKSNREEFRKYRKAEYKNKLVILQKLCPIHTKYLGGFVLVMQKADRHLTQEEFEKCEKVLELPKYHKWFNDVTINNVMWMGDRVVMVDYANNKKQKGVGIRRDLIIYDL